jgi:hypothetical protein
MARPVGVSVSIRGPPDRAIVAVMAYTFARVGVLVALSVEDYSTKKTASSIAPVGI